MKQDDSNWVREMFDATARVWTPDSARSVAHVLYAPLSSSPESSRRCAAVLSDTERLRAKRFVTEDLTSHFLQRRAFRRYCGALALGSARPLSQIDFSETEKGRPYLSDRPDIWFSFSSCRIGFFAGWSSTRMIGVDLEVQTGNLEVTELAQLYFGKAGVKAVATAHGLAQQKTFFQLWTLKEAALKSIGEGLPFGLDAFEFELGTHPRILQTPRDYGGSERFSAHVMEEGNCCAALVTRERDPISSQE